MGALSKQRGDHFEREVCAVLTEQLGRNVKRQLGQARDGGGDILVAPFLIECKRTRALGKVYGWLDQALAATQILNGRQVPIVVARADARESIAVLRLTDLIPLIREELE